MPDEKVPDNYFSVSYRAEPHFTLEKAGRRAEVYVTEVERHPDGPKWPYSMTVVFDKGVPYEDYYSVAKEVMDNPEYGYPVRDRGELFNVLDIEDGAAQFPGKLALVIVPAKPGDDILFEDVFVSTINRLDPIDPTLN